MGKTVKDREYSFQHCKERAKERYGLELTRDAWEQWAEECRRTVEFAIYTNTNGKIVQTTHVIYWWGVKLIVVYENKRDCITTLLPPEKDLHFAGRLVDKPRYCLGCSDVHRPTERCV